MSRERFEAEIQKLLAMSSPDDREDQAKVLSDLYGAAQNSLDELDDLDEVRRLSQDGLVAEVKTLTERLAAAEAEVASLKKVALANQNAALDLSGKLDAAEAAKGARP